MVRYTAQAAINYWIGTTRPDGRPHAVPVWGVWLDEDFYFEGGPDTRRGRNLAANPAVGIHVERGDEVAILEGTVEQIAGPDQALADNLVEAFDAKYGPKYNYHPKPDQWQEGGLYLVHPGGVRLEQVPGGLHKVALRGVTFMREGSCNWVPSHFNGRALQAGLGCMNGGLRQPSPPCA